MNVGESFNKSFPLFPQEVNGKKALRVGEKDGYLVRLDMESKEWNLVDSVDKAVPFDELKEYYGIWKDRELTSGSLFWKKQIRPLDGVIQRDEVTEFQSAYSGTERQVDKTYSNSKSHSATCIFSILSPEAEIIINQKTEGPPLLLQETWKCIDHKIISM
jgi:hypothetical protein